MAKKRYADGYMIYGCEDCGKGFQMFVEEGLEDHSLKNIKPVPFAIQCPFCGGSDCRDQMFKKFPLKPHVRLRRDVPFFANIPSENSGVPTHMSYAQPQFKKKDKEE